MIRTMYIFKTGWVVWMDAIESPECPPPDLKIRTPGLEATSNLALMVGTVEVIDQLRHDTEYRELPIIWRHYLEGERFWDAEAQEYVSLLTKENTGDIRLNIAHPACPKSIYVPQWKFVDKKPVHRCNNVVLFT